MATMNMTYRTVLEVAAGAAGIVDAGGGLFYKDFSIAPTAVKLGSTFLLSEAAESRIPTVPEPSLTLEHRGAFVTLVGVSTLRLYWRGALATDAEAGPEKISVGVQLLDLNELGNSFLEVLFRLQRILGELGNNQIQDLLVRDDPGNVTQYRVRVFDTKANAQAATKNLPDGSPLEAGELSRRTVVVQIDVRKNDRTSLTGVQDLILTPTPGVS
jgi:hypothetical protein